MARQAKKAGVGWWLWCAILTTIVGLGCNLPVSIEEMGAQTLTAATVVTIVGETPTGRPSTNATPPTQPTSTTLRIKLYFVALGDNGTSGKQIGCGDSLIPVLWDIPHTASPLTDTLNALFSVKSQYYGQSGLYNSLYQSALTVEGISAHDGNFRVNLIGQTRLGGVCDSPRFVAQIKETILQFATVKSADVYVNGIALEALLSGAG